MIFLVRTTILCHMIDSEEEMVAVINSFDKLRGLKRNLRICFEIERNRQDAGRAAESK